MKIQDVLDKYPDRETERVSPDRMDSILDSSFFTGDSFCSFGFKTDEGRVALGRNRKIYIEEVA